MLLLKDDLARIRKNNGLGNDEWPSRQQLLDAGCRVIPMVEDGDRRFKDDSYRILRKNKEFSDLAIEDFKEVRIDRTDFFEGIYSDGLDPHDPPPLWKIADPEPVKYDDLLRLTRSNVNLARFDFVLGMKGDVKPSGDFKHAGKYDLPDGNRGDRLKAAVWSWAEGDPGPFRTEHLERDVVIDGGGPDGERWVSAEPDAGEFTFALRSIDRLDANGNVDHVSGSYLWKASTATFSNWHDYRQVAETDIFDDDGDDIPDWLFAGPINGLDNWNLHLLKYGSPIRSWLNVHDFYTEEDGYRDGIWTVDETILALPRDEFEDNDTLATAAVLGSVPQMTFRDLTIHHYTDVDYYKVTAPETGKMLVNIHFAHTDGDLNLQILDGEGNLIASSESETDDEGLVIPVVAQQRYYVYVESPIGDINWYDLEIETYAAPAPLGNRSAFAERPGDLQRRQHHRRRHDTTARLCRFGEIHRGPDRGSHVRPGERGARPPGPRLWSSWPTRRPVPLPAVMPSRSERTRRCLHSPRLHSATPITG